MIRRARRLVMRATLSAIAAVVGLSVSVLILAVMASQTVASWGRAYGSSDVSRVPSVDAALVLGTLIHNLSGGLNPAFAHRLDAAVELWRAGKVRYLIVSGNGEDQAHDEPTVMRDLLVLRGVPAGVIYRDSAGLRTVRSIVRARDIYGLKRLIVVSQQDHVERALFLARHMGVEAWGYEAAEGAPPYVRWYNPLRPRFAALYAYWDLVTGVRPAAGPRIAIGVDPPG
jgi:SanA protein